ncbi:uncharacterized protein PB18E9.04c-like [Teleopsis dalmanni]|uniref:uncharacterized protein PB18E9.04c-like n=1 Tax=Teleopsis dalmanni TaxID=139649 RepID=UPI0018CD86B9|nr:uncharacterized protein PB18E9.04c-like [Teleopsis dalmanni]
MKFGKICIEKHVKATCIGSDRDTLATVAVTSVLGSGCLQPGNMEDSNNLNSYAFLSVDTRELRTAHIVQTGKYLVLTNVSSADRGLYVCFASVPPRNATDIALEIVNSTKTDVAIRVELYSNNSVFSNSDTSVETNVDLLKTTTPTIPAIPATPKNVKLLQTESATTTTTKTTAATATASTNIIRKTKTNATTAFTTSPITTSTTVALTKLSSSSSSSLAPHTIANSSSSTTNSTLPTLNEEEEQEYQAILKVNLTVRTPPGPVSQLYFKASTILGFLIWRFNKTAAGGYPVRSFTAEYRNVSYVQTPYNSSFEHAWIRMDPINIAPNVDIGDLLLRGFSLVSS